jgi:hypothetical protein
MGLTHHCMLQKRLQAQSQTSPRRAPLPSATLQASVIRVQRRKNRNEHARRSNTDEIPTAQMATVVQRRPRAPWESSLLSPIGSNPPWPEPVGQARRAHRTRCTLADRTSMVYGRRPEEAEVDAPKPHDQFGGS